MNGVRRFLSAAGASSSPSPPSVSRELPNPPPFVTKPINGPSWPPPSPSTVTPLTPALSIKESSIRRLQPTPPPDDSPPPVPPPKGLALRKLITQHQILSDKRSSGASSASGHTTKRDELLLSLLASQAVVDSRDFEILDSEQVEELTKEHQLLSNRLEAMSKRLRTETKIRDAAVSLSKVNASTKKVSKQTEEQLAAANKRVDAAQQDLFRLSERVHEVYRRLLEHRASVLSYSLRNLEKAATRGSANGVGEDPEYDSSIRNTLMSPSTSSMTGFSTSAKARFDGPHLFAGHAEAIVPRRKYSGEVAAVEITSLEEKLKAATDSLTAAGKKQAELTRELSMMKLEKAEVETMMSLDLQSAEETIQALRKEMSKLEELDAAIKQLQEEKRAWLDEKSRLEDRVTNGREIESMRETRETHSEKESEESRKMLQEKEEELLWTRAQWQAERDAWESLKTELEDEKMEDLARLQQEVDTAREEDERVLQRTNEELDAGLGALRSLVKQHGIVLFSRNTSLEGLLSSVGTHLETVHGKLEAYSRAESEWDTVRRKLEADIRTGLDKREALAHDLEEARRDRDEARREARITAERSNVRDTSSSQLSSMSPDNTGHIMQVLMPLWSILPSPEARAAKFNQSKYRTISPTHSPGPNKSVSSLSELDVRSLKSLYDSTRQPILPAASSDEFSIEAFAARVQALLQDDRALIERLLRFAQAHDLLKKNAERAQKLAQEGNVALETYQRQVRTLEERNMMLASKQAAMIEEMQQLQNSLERADDEKREVEILAAEQAETCAQLTEANNALSARTLTLAEEAASGPEKVRKQLEAQLSEARVALQNARDEVDAMRTSEQSQRIALLDELNTTQKENELLRAQLRARK
ncbi:hypothetical protein C0992_009189 [Termitomyces sp. T32_za158]|nr:hypothetical protein C0992_009189 [Termitomyces sp. T32_za158]